MVVITHILLLAALSQASRMESRVEHGDPSATEGFLQQAHADYQTLIGAVKTYKGNSSDIDNGLNNVYYDIFNAGDGSEGWHISGPYTERDARSICNYINTTIYSDTKKLTAAVLKKKRSFVAHGYNGTLSDSLNSLSDDYDTNIDYISGACRGTKAQATCDQASGSIRTLLGTTAHDLVN